MKLNVRIDGIVHQCDTNTDDEGYYVPVACGMFILIAALNGRSRCRTDEQVTCFECLSVTA